MATITSQIFTVFVAVLFIRLEKPTYGPSWRPYASFTSAMAWQKTFTLAKRSKGCHLVTEEILSHIESGLNSVQVRPYAYSHFG